MRKRSLLASHFPLLRSLGALQWALQRGHIATEEEAQSGVRSGRSRQNSEITQYVGFFIVTVTITAALAAGLGAHVSAGRLWVAFASFLWAGSTSCNVAGAFATIKAASA
jgi:hypothetical protein